jgi:hypothetical protein
MEFFIGTSGICCLLSNVQGTPQLRRELKEGARMFRACG